MGLVKKKHKRLGLTQRPVCGYWRIKPVLTIAWTEVTCQACLKKMPTKVRAKHGD